MGEDFLRNKQRDFKRRMDKVYKAFLEGRDLFSDVSPRPTAEVIGLVVERPGVTPGVTLEELRGDRLAPSRMILVCDVGGLVELDGEAAIQVRRAEKKLGGPLTKTIKETSPDGLVRILLEPPIPAHPRKIHQGATKRLDDARP